MKKAVDIFQTFQLSTEEGEADDSDDTNITVEDSSTLDDDTVWQSLETEEAQCVEQVMANNCTSRLACFAHTLQLTVRDGVEKISCTRGQNMKTVMGKCVKIANICHQSAQFRELFEEKLGTGRSIPAANATRWNSIFTQLQAVCNLDRMKLEDVLRSAEQSHLIITVRDFAMLQELVDILEPFAEATEVTQGDKYATIGCVTPCVIGLHNCLSRLQQSTRYHGAVVRELTESLHTRFGGLLTNVGILDEPSNSGFVNLIYPMASLLDPNYGFVWLEDDLPVSVAVKEALQQRLIDTITKEAEACCLITGITVDAVKLGNKK